MNRIYKFIWILIIPLMAFGMHKHYISLTKVDYVKDKQAVQITMKFFLDDIEHALETRYEEPMDLSSQFENEEASQFLETYVRQKFKVWINGMEYNYNYLGKEYDNNDLYFYLEIENVEDIRSISVQNSMLFEAFEEQKNYIKINVDSTQKTFILVKANDKEMLKL